ncbi:hypothetical protein [uncultured Halovibrio sp.]|uniref:hypothetical protein n=1 Tax=uncultured Halovibrio sp. TaxID=985049 RepID=UPI0025FEDDD8|nr:hypothetical protein [uncultured Halovibrio sp.]
MLGALDTYALRDFVPVTPEVWARLFERLNGQVWPWQGLFLLLMLFALWRLHRGGSATAGLALAACWCWSAVQFQFLLHAPLNWAASLMGWAFMVQAVLVFLVGLGGGWRFSGGLRAKLGVVLVLAGIVVLPVTGPLTGRSWAAFEVAGTAPTPTALVTLGMLLLARPISWVTGVIPVLWLVYSSVIWWVSGWLPGAVVAPLAIGTLGVAMGASPWSRGREPS